jgi:hypothetical protein
MAKKIGLGRKPGTKVGKADDAAPAPRRRKSETASAE